MQVNPGVLVELPENGEIGFESQQAEIEQVVNAIDRLIKWCCVSNGLSAASMSTDTSEASGLSKILDSKELSEMRTDDIALWRNYEKNLFNLMRIVHNVHSKKKLPENISLSVDFADIEKQTTSAKDQAVTWDLELSMGIISAVDILLEKNPDFQGDRDKAMAHLLKVRDENKELGISE